MPRRNRKWGGFDYCAAAAWVVQCIVMSLLMLPGTINGDWFSIAMLAFSTITGTWAIAEIIVARRSGAVSPRIMNE